MTQRRRHPRPGEDTDTAPQADQTAVFSLADLAERSGVSARTIRYYQTRKLLPRPYKDRDDGRVARYGEAHLARLSHIGELHDRGLTLTAIRDLLDADDAAARVKQWLGLDESLGGSWAGDEPQLLTSADVAALLEGTPKGTTAQFETAGLLRREGSSWLAPAPELLALAAGLIRDGLDADLVLRAGEILRKHLRRGSAELTVLFRDAFASGIGDGADPGELLQPLRPISGDAVRLIFARELERAITELLADPKRLARRSTRR